MSPDQQQKTVEIAEALGCINFGFISWPDGTRTFNGCSPDNKDAFVQVPSYFTDLNACAQARAGFTEEQQERYMMHLAKVLTENGFDPTTHNETQCTFALFNSSAPQQAEATHRVLCAHFISEKHEPQLVLAACPKCGGTDIEKMHAMNPPPVYCETSWLQCNACDHQWNHQ